jgi:hypothetical protein
MTVQKLLLILIFIASVSHADIITGLIHHYDFENGNADDTAGTNNGNLVGTPVFSTISGPRSGIVSVSDGNIIELPNVASIPTGSADRTFAVWAKIDNFENQAALWHHGLNSNQRDFSLEVRAGDGNMAFNGWNADFPFTIATNPNDWHHFAVTYSGPTTQAYLDGQPIASTAVALNTGSNIIRLGGQRLNNSGQQLDGSLDDFYIYNRALSGPDVMELYNTTAIPEPSALSLIAFAGLVLAGFRKFRA